MRKVLLLTIGIWLTLFLAAAALAADPGKAKEEANLHAQKRDGAKVVATVKAGDAVTVLVTQGDWMRVKTAAGKLGWVKTSAIEVEKAKGDDLGDLDMSGVEVAAAEQDTIGAVRGRPGATRVVVLAAGYSDVQAAQLVDILDDNKRFRIVARVVKPDAAGSGPTGPAGGADAGKQLATALGADVVVAVSPSQAGPNGGPHVRYEVVDARTGKVTATGNEPADQGVMQAFKTVAAKVR